MKIGLKLWSTNDFYIEEAKRLYSLGVYDFIELFIVPGSLVFLPKWQQVSVPYSLHAPHSYQGLNWAKDDVVKDRRAILDELLCYFRALKAKYVLFHPGLDGALEKTLKNMEEARHVLPDLFSCALVENKPKLALMGEECVGSSPAEIGRILKATGFGFCLDIGHAVCYSAALGLDHSKVIEEFLSLGPVLFHVSDGDAKSWQDNHGHLGQGNYDLPDLISRLPGDARIVIETDKGSREDLDDFVQDVGFFRSLLKRV